MTPPPPVTAAAPPAFRPRAGLGHRLEPVLQIGRHRQPFYQELLLRPARPRALPLQALVRRLEQRGRIHLLDGAMLDRALELLAADPALVLAVNLSPRTLAHAGHRGRLLELLEAATPALRRRLLIELIESPLLAEPQRWRAWLAPFRRLGLRLAIDDFGCGCCGLGHLFGLAPDLVKLAGPYARRIGDPAIDALVRFLRAVERSGGPGLILEGIETEAQLRHWRRRGVRKFQGWLFQPPEPAGSPGWAIAPRRGAG